jgi:hypothetical protein
MAEIINLKDLRKARVRAEAATKAAENRTRFGRTRIERDRQASEDQRARRDHDGNRLERPARGNEAPAETSGSGKVRGAKDTDTPDGADQG